MKVIFFNVPINQSFISFFIFILYFFFIYIKASKNLLAKYYLLSKQRLQRNFKKYVKIFLQKRKEKKQLYGCEHYKNLSEDEKNKLVEYKNFTEW